MELGAHCLIHYRHADPGSPRVAIYYLPKSWMVIPELHKTQKMSGHLMEKWGLEEELVAGTGWSQSV